MLRQGYVKAGLWVGIGAGEWGVGVNGSRGDVWEKR